MPDLGHVNVKITVVLLVYYTNMSKLKHDCPAYKGYKLHLTTTKRTHDKIVS